MPIDEQEYPDSTGTLSSTVVQDHSVYITEEELIAAAKGSNGLKIDHVVGSIKSTTPKISAAKLFSPAATSRSGILAEASRVVTSDRTAVHGKPEDSFGKLAAVWSALLGVELTSSQCAMLLAALKIVRASDNPTHLDNWVDLAGYAACAGEAAFRGEAK